MRRRDLAGILVVGDVYAANDRLRETELMDGPPHERPGNKPIVGSASFQSLKAGEELR
jgi:hypothetical protein